MIDIEKYLSNFFKGTRAPSLETMEYFMAEYNNFQKEMKFIHIAGTNGKGSCTEMITSILIKEGYKVGKFISPHLIRYNERISINRVEITNKEMSDLIEELQPKIDKYNRSHKTNITLFALETMMALLYFYRSKVDFIILETGLGGLNDCTNIISNPLVSVITSIGYDHMNILGNTLDEIAYQKAGIIKENSNTVIFDQSNEINQVFIDVCMKKRNTLHIITKDKIKNYSYDNNFQYFDYEDLEKVAINLKGIKQINNASLSIETMKILNKLGYEVSNISIKNGLSKVIHKARMELLNEAPKIVYDGAHNNPAIKNLQKTVQMYYKDFKRIYIISILKGKDYKKMLELLSEDENATFILTSGNNEKRYTLKEELYDVFMKYKKKEQKIYMKDLIKAVEFVMSHENKQERNVTLIVGSFYVYGDVICKIKEMNNKNIN